MNMFLKCVQVDLFSWVPLDVLVTLSLPEVTDVILRLFVVLRTVLVLRIVPNFIQVGVIQADHG